MSSGDATTYIVPENVTGRIDKILAQAFSDYSRTYFQELIDKGTVTLNGKKVRVAKTEVVAGDVLVFSHTPRPAFNLVPQKVDFQVIDIQPDFIIIHKPAGLLVHAPSNRSQEITLVNGLLYAFTELRDMLEASDRPGIIHRLDEDTSGLLIVARNERGKNKLSKMFHDRQLTKKYLAVVRGHTPASGSISFSIGRHPTVRNKMSHQAVNARTALTHFTARQYLRNATLLDLHIVTGRTHQIRVHCSAIGHPLLGDELYGLPTPHIKRQALHAYHLAFFYDGKNFSYTLPLPEDMQKLVNLLIDIELDQSLLPERGE